MAQGVAPRGHEGPQRSEPELPPCAELRVQCERQRSVALINHDSCVELQARSPGAFQVKRSPLLGAEAQATRQYAHLLRTGARERPDI